MSSARRRSRPSLPRSGSARIAVSTRRGRAPCRRRRPETEVVFVGEGPGFNQDRQGRPFVGRAGDLLVKLLASIGWRRDDVFITNVVKCRPPDNRDPQPDEIAACAPYLQRQLAVLDPAVIVTLGRYSMATFMPGARISQAHGTVRPVDAATGAASATVFAMYQPGGGTADPRHRARELRGHRGRPSHAASASRAARREAATASDQASRRPADARQPEPETTPAPSTVTDPMPPPN